MPNVQNLQTTATTQLNEWVETQKYIRHERKRPTLDVIGSRLRNLIANYPNPGPFEIDRRINDIDNHVSTWTQNGVKEINKAASAEGVEVRVYQVAIKDVKDGFCCFASKQNQKRLIAEWADKTAAERDMKTYIEQQVEDSGNLCFPEGGEVQSVTRVV